jgi:hypothetical protein
MYTGDLLERMYPDEDPVQNVQRRDHLVDLYLNMPDKVGKWLLRLSSAHSGFFLLCVGSVPGTVPSRS